MRAGYASESALAGRLKPRMMRRCGRWALRLILVAAHRDHHHTGGIQPASRAPAGELERWPTTPFMCLAVFLASDHLLPERPWSADDPAFNVAVIGPAEEAVRKQFSKRHVVYLGAHTGCGCGFDPAGDDDEGSPAVRAASRAALAEYVAAATMTDSAELFVCWEGDGALPPATHLVMPASELAQRTDWLAELTFVEIPKSACRIEPSPG